MMTRGLLLAATFAAMSYGFVALADDDASNPSLPPSTFLAPKDVPDDDLHIRDRQLLLAPEDVPDEDGGVNAPSPQYIQSQKLVISWSENMDVAWGFSMSKGEWVKQALDPPATKLPMVGPSIAVIHTGSNIYAFSGTVGRWDTLRLPKGEKPHVTVDDDLALVAHEGQVHTFAGATGRWTSPGASDDEQESGPSSQKEIKVFALQNSLAKDAEPIVDALFGNLDVSLAVDYRTNSLIVGGDPNVLAKIEAVLLRLDEQQTPAKSNARQESEALTEQLHSLKSDYQAAERRTADLAQRLHETPPKADAKKQLRDAVAEAFQARQRLHRAELAEFQLRMRRIERSLQSRDRIQEEIIDRRVEELLRPDVRWSHPAPGVEDQSVLKKKADTSENPLGAASAVGQSQAVRALPELGDRPDSIDVSGQIEVQLHFTGPSGAKVGRKSLSPEDNNTPFSLPARFTATTGESMEFSLLVPQEYFARRGVERLAQKVPSLQLSATLRLASLDKAAVSFLRHNALPVRFTDEDILQAVAGNQLVTKVIYLPDANIAELAVSKVETVVTARLDPGVDPIVEAGRRGQILAILQLGNRATAPL